MKTPTICHICDYGSQYGGTFIDSLLFLSRYCRDKLQVATFCIFPDRAKNRSWLSNLDAEGIGYGFVPHKRNVAGPIRSLLVGREPLVLHSHFFTYDLTTVLLKYTTFKNSGIVWHYHNPCGGSVKQSIKDVLKIRLLLNLLGNYCIAVGDGVYKSVRDAGLAPDKAILLHNGVNIGRFFNKCEVVPEARKTLGLSSEDMVFLLLGWSPRRKGVDIFFKAAEELGRKFTNCKFLVVGKEETREFVSQLRYKSPLSPDAFRVVDPVEDFSVILKVTDVLVLASRSEGLPYAVLEAMTAGKLVISSALPAARETYGRSNGAWLFPTEDWKMLAELMEKGVLLQADERRSLGQANSQYVIENHSLGQWSKRIGELYEGVTSRYQRTLS
ncbi:hypothetical protein COMA1_90008 [Candidatus Nitrospira nitrosa]|uniref:Glycosyl transferase family 1 domain-containing protein n=1 Tax=Candidatus Nitrospira nitrosa TaxID=1742972 RepID=A0A0S4LUJ2_9BACT|nr:glycosyltransferase family 4 protein [Candidatus Nitrospira nitrosa]CUS39684.1 hypothetical protein COMA1_90008 [Candidatus Nitrospira nitrosa]